MVNRPLETSEYIYNVINQEISGKGLGWDAVVIQARYCLERERSEVVVF